MKAKCIRLFTLNLYVFYFLLLCIRKGLTITTNHGSTMHHTLFRHDRHYKSSGFQSNQQQHPSKHTPTTGINEAVHAFHPSNNLHLLHSLQYNPHYMRSLSTTTTRKPFTTRQIRQNNFIQNPSKPIATSNNHHISLKLQNHSHKPPFRHTTLISVSPSTVAPENVHRNSLTHDEYVRKRNKAENLFFTTSKYGTIAAPQSIALSKSSASIHSISKSLTQTHPTPQLRRPLYRGGEEQDDYFNEFNEKNYKSNTFRAKSYRGIIADGNRGKEMNLKNVINDDDNEDVEEDDDDEDDEEYDDYLDDESTLEEAGQIGSLTNEKWETLGTREAVDKSRTQITHRTLNEMAVHNVTAHSSRIYMEALCKVPKPKIIPIVDASKTYAPHCTVLHRCGDDTGCCNTDALTCVPKKTATVDLYFYVSSMGKREQTVEYLTFINHTECHCISRHNSVHNQNPYNRSIAARNNPTMASESHSPSGKNCQCVKHYKVFYERVEASDEDVEDGVAKGSQLCRCDCEAENVSCDWLKKGKDGFSIEDRRCIVDKRCVRPACEYGQYNMRMGRCPKLEDKLAGARSLFFD